MQKLRGLLKASYLLFVCIASCPAFMAVGQQVGAPANQPGFMKDVILPAHKKVGTTVTPPSKSSTDTTELKTNETANAEVHEVDSSGTVLVPVPFPARATADGTPARQVYIRVKTTPVPSDSLHDDSEYEDFDPLVSKYATMLSVDPNEIVNFPLYRFVDQWYGIPYKWGGNDTTGIDCSAFTQKLYGNIFGKDIYRTARLQRRNCERIRNIEDALEGDLVFFRVRHLRISHVGVYLANGYFVHSSRSHGVVISSLNDKYWHRRYAGCGRIDREDKPTAESDFMP